MDDQAYGVKRNFKPLIILGVGLIIIISVIVFLINNVVVIVNTTGTSNSPVTTSAVSSTGTVAVGGGGLVIVPRSTQSLIVASGDYVKTRTSVDLPWYGFTTKTVQLDVDKNADKVAFSGTNPLCVTYSSSADKLYNYSCAKPTALLDYQTPADKDWGNKTAADLSYVENQTLPPYMGGVIGIAEGPRAPFGQNDPTGHKAAVVATSVGVKNMYDAPSGITLSNLAGLRVFTDTTSSTNNHFVLADLFGTIYLATPSADGKTVSYKQITAPDDYSYRYNQTLCSLDGESVYCYRGRTSVTVDKDAKFTAPSVVQLSYTDGLVGSSKVDSSVVFDGFYSSNDKLYVRSAKSLYTLNKTDGIYTTHVVLQNALNMTVDKKVYYVADNGLYELDETTGDSHQVFFSANIAIAGVYSVDGKLFVFGLTRVSNPEAYAYLVSSESDTTPGKRVIDLLPLASGALQGLKSNNFVGDKYLLRTESDAVADDIKNNFISTFDSLDIKSENITLIH